MSGRHAAAGARDVGRQRWRDHHRLCVAECVSPIVLSVDVPALSYLSLGSRSMSSLPSFSTANLTALQTLILGDEALQYCRELVVADSPVLSRIEIGSGCFMKGNALSLGSGIAFVV